MKTVPIRLNGEVQMASRHGLGISKPELPNSATPAPSFQESRSLSDPSLYINRELSLLAFQRRVLEEADDPSNPLLERVKFLSIVGSNLDEFFMIRVAGLMKQVESGSPEVPADGMTPTEQLDAIRAEVAALIAVAHKIFRRQLL